MEYSCSRKDASCVMHLSGQFTFNDNTRFREILALARDEDIRHISMDFTNVDYIDSAGLGMLLLLYELGRERQLTIALSNAKGQPNKMFSLSQFDQIFTITG